MDTDSEGSPVLVWCQKTAGDYRVCFSRFSGAAWGDSKPISPAGANAFRPDVFCRSPNEAVIAWYAWKRVDLRDFPNSWWRTIYVTVLSRGQVGPIDELAKLERGSDDCWNPSITWTTDATRVCWFRDENPPLPFFSAFEAGRWSPQKPLLKVQNRGGKFHNLRAASPVRSAGGRRGLVFEMKSANRTGPLAEGTHIYAQFPDGDAWAQPIQVSSEPGVHVAPCAVQSPAGDSFLFWSRLSGQRAAILTCLLGKEKPAKTEGLVGGPGRNLYPSACYDATGQLWLAWQSDAPRVPPVIYGSALPPTSKPPMSAQ